MPQLEPPDITNQPDRDNIERILRYLGRLELVPGAALDAIAGLLIRAEVAERHRVATTEPIPSAPQDGRVVQVPGGQRKAFSRRVRLKDHAVTCRNCGQTVIVRSYPGAFPPSVCSAQCKREIQRQDNAARQRRFRERQKQEAEQ